jgi:hypothetical protein
MHIYWFFCSTADIQININILKYVFLAFYFVFNRIDYFNNIILIKFGTYILLKKKKLPSLYFFLSLHQYEDVPSNQI